MSPEASPFPQDDIMRPERIKLQYQAALTHPTAVISPLLQLLYIYKFNLNQLKFRLLAASLNEILPIQLPDIRNGQTA